jgi:RNA polymerase sigma-70 factor (ECF subfamily)
MTIRSELRRLSNEQQEAIKLRVIDELAYSEVARALNISEQAARLRVSRGLRSLATALKDNSAVKEVRT